MALFKGTRYKDSVVVGIQGTDGVTRRLVSPKEPINADDLGGKYFKHTVVGEETLDYIAYIYYRDETKWSIIAEANNIFFAYDIQHGQELIIPDRSIIEN